MTLHMSRNKGNPISRTPNIMVVFTDQQRWDTCGCYGQALPVTPNLDRMAAAGVRFEHAFTCQPVCGPARACLQTGRYASATGCYRNGIPLPPGERTLAHWLGEAGYDTGFIGKWHLASKLPDNNVPYSTEGTRPEEFFETSPVPPERRGGYVYWLASDVLESTSFSYWGYMFDTAGRRRDFPPGRYRADVLGDWALEFLDSRRRDHPFFLFLSFVEPHHNYQNSRDWYEGPHGSKERWAEFEVPRDLADTKGDWRESYPDYLGCCSAVDQNLGRLRTWLADNGLADNTLLIFTSDHGSHFRTRNSEYKRSCHEASIRIPMVIEGPGFQGGCVVRDLVSLIDLPPTILAGAGVAAPPSMQGSALQAVALGQAKNWPREVFIQITEDHIGRALRAERWKYEVWVPSERHMSGWARGDSTVYHEHHFYDLSNDPHERNDLVADPAYEAVRAELAATLRRRMIQAGEPEPVILPSAIPEGTNA